MGTVEQVDLFEFLRLVAVAAGRGRLTRDQGAVATLTALDSDGTKGTGVVVNAARTAIELDISERQVWRHFRALVQAGWFAQTVKPTKGAAGEGGRRARYRVLAPVMDLGLPGLPPATVRVPAVGGGVSNGDSPERVPTADAAVSDDDLPERLTLPTEELAHEDAAGDSSSDSSAPHRLTVSAEPSDTAEPEVGTVPTSDGPTSDGPTIVASRFEQPQDAREVGSVDNSPVVGEIPTGMSAAVVEATSAAAEVTEVQAAPPAAAATTSDLDTALHLLSEFAGQSAANCTQAVRGQLARGWRPEQLAEHVRRGGKIDGANYPAAVLRSRVERLGPPPAVKPPWCGDCHERTRLIDTPDGSARRCPACHPKRAASNCADCAHLQKTNPAWRCGDHLVEAAAS